MSRKRLVDILIVIGAVAFIVAAIWFQIVRPCWTFDYTAIKDVPARCIDQN